MAEETNKPGRPAFEPTVFPEVSKLGEAMLIEGGLSRRELFAIKITQSLLVRGWRCSQDPDGTMTAADYRYRYPGWIAFDAVQITDALIAELDKGKDKENEMA
jgi:hypothetical protein